MAKVGIVMGSDSDMPVMAKAADVLKELGIDFEMTIISAHREPEEFFEYAKTAEEKGVRLIDKAPRPGAEGLNIAFLHPKSTGSVLTELCEHPEK